MSNPLISQGTLNRLRGSLSVVNYPNLNVTASYLGEAGISVALDGAATTNLPTMTGLIPSGEPYQPATITINILKTQALAPQYKSQMELATFLGDCVFTPDAATLPSYYFSTCSIIGLRELDTSGKNAGFVLTLGGYYNINSSLWS